MSNTKTEQRTISMALRAAPDSSFELAGLAAAYNSLSGPIPVGNGQTFREQIKPGAFTRTLASNPDVICCINHDPSKLLGRTTSGTLSLSDSPEGLRFVCKLDPNQQSHRDLHASVKRGDLNECSFAFDVADDGEKWEDAKDERGQIFARRTLTRLNLFDVSVVTRPAYPGSTSVSARAQYRMAQLWSPTLGDWSDLRAIALRQKAEIFEQNNPHRLTEADLASARGRLEDKKLRERLELQGRQIRVQDILAEMKELVE